MMDSDKSQEETLLLRSSLFDRTQYFNCNYKHLLGSTLIIRGPNGRLAAVGESSELPAMFDRFTDWLNSETAMLPPRMEGMG